MTDVDTLLAEHASLVDRAVIDVAKGQAVSDEDDMRQDGLIALWGCAQSWNRTGSFSGYAYQRIRWAIIDGLRSRTTFHRSTKEARRPSSIDTDRAALIPDPTPSPDQVAVDRDRLARVEAWLARQDARTVDSIIATNQLMELGESKINQAAAADLHGVTASRMSQIRTAALVELREVAA